LTQANDALEEKYAAALASQDYAAAAKAQREMSSNEAKLNDLNRGKTAMENAPKVTPRVSDDPVERIASQLTAQSAAWVRAHPEYARDPAKYRKMVAAHELAMADGFSPDTPEYFASVEDTLRIAAPRQEVQIETDPTADAARPSTTRPSRQTAPPSAPVTRSGNGTGATRRNVVTLTPEQVEIAKMMGQTPEEYAREVVALRKEGKLN
jgi:phage I-like protein